MLAHRCLPHDAPDRSGLPPHRTNDQANNQDPPPYFEFTWWPVPAHRESDRRRKERNERSTGGDPSNLRFLVLGAIAQHLAGTEALGGADEALVFEDVHQAGGAGIADAEAALEHGC